MILVVGATGHLGSTIVFKLLERGQPVRALVRKTSQYAYLQQKGAEIAFGDLRDPASLEAACQGIEVVIATANTATPSQKSDTFAAVDGQGYRDLIDICKKQGVQQFIYTSVPVSKYGDALPFHAQKRKTDTYLQNSSLGYTILRPCPFMDFQFAVLGSDLPIRGAVAPSVLRPFKFLNNFYNGVRHNIDQKGTVGIIGNGTARHTYICINDVAEFHVKAIGHPQAKNATIDLGGPQALTPLDVKAIYEKVLGKPLTARHTPALIFRVASLVLSPFAPAVSNIMGLIYLGSTENTRIDMTETAKQFDVKLTSAEEFLRQKASLPA